MTLKETIEMCQLPWRERHITGPSRMLESSDGLSAISCTGFGIHAARQKAAIDLALLAVNILPKVLEALEPFANMQPAELMYPDAYGGVNRAAIKKAKAVMAEANNTTNMEHEKRPEGYQNDWNCPHCGGETEDECDGTRRCPPCSHTFEPPKQP